MTGKSSCSSSAPSSMNKSSTSSTTSSGLAPGRSILLRTTSGFLPSASAFLSTKRVCGMQPSNASTSSTTPSTSCKIRSTSPPKSACPGVSTMLILILLYITVGIHHALLHRFVLAEYAALTQQLVNQCGLAVVNVGDNRDISQIFSNVHNRSRFLIDSIFLL